MDITELRVEDTKKLLRIWNLSSCGNKNELIQRLVEANGFTEIEIKPETNIQTQSNELHGMFQ